MTLAPSQYSGASTKTIGMFSKLMAQGSQFVMEGVKNLVVKKQVRPIFYYFNKVIIGAVVQLIVFFLLKQLPVTRIVDALMELKSMQETDDFRYFDPKVSRATVA